MPAAKIPSLGLTDTWGRRNRTHANKLCAECSAVFRPKRADSAFCSRPCARKKNGGQNAKLESWWVNAKGYVEGKIWTAQGQRRVKLHRLVMERHLGRRLGPGEEVHHVNEDKQDNRLANLQVLSASEHSRLHNIARAAIAKASQPLHQGAA